MATTLGAGSRCSSTIRGAPDTVPTLTAGYFTLPYLVKAGAAHVHACEWNPNAVDALRRNLASNGVETRCTVYPGDNRDPATRAALRGVADRVNLGLIPTSEPGWGAGVGALKLGGGGWLHVHENVAHGAEGELAARLCAVVSGLWAARGPPGGAAAWEVACRRVEHVKSYAPRVDHCVFDVRVSRLRTRTAVLQV